MKNFLILLFVLCAITVSYGRWLQQNSGTSEHLHGVQFVNNSVGFVVGDNGTFLKTTDGGNTWNQLNANTVASLFCICMLSENLGWIAAGNGEIYKTQNGGNSWTLQQSGTTDPIYNIQFVDENHGWASKFYNEILVTTNSGSNWVNYSTGINNIILAMFFTDLHTGWVGGWGGTVMKTNDGGLTWTPQYSGTSITRASLFFLTNNLGWSAGGGGAITRTIDGGATWTLLNSGASEFLNSIFFISPDTGWVTGGEKVYVTFDGGLTWQNQLYVYGKNFTDLWFEKSNLGWLVGYGGTIYTYVFSPMVSILDPNGGENYLVGDSEEIIWESGDADTLKLEYSTDGGQSWVVIVDKMPAINGRYLWEIPNTPTTTALIKLSLVDSPEVFDISDNYFSISRAPQIISPNGEEYFYFDQLCDFIWQDGGVEYIKIELSRDEGNHWELISASTPAPSGSFSWMVTPPRSDRCLLKITDVEFPNFYDISNYTFVIDSLFSPYHYFPLSPGNIWCFQNVYQTIVTILNAENDTLLSDGNVYTQINRYDRTYWWDHWKLTRTEFLRQEGDSVLIYPDSVLLDFNWQSRDTIFFSPANFVVVDTIYALNIFGRFLNTYYLHSSSMSSYSFSDGIGYNTLSAWQNYPSRPLAGFFIDGIRYGNVIVSIDEKNKPAISDYRLEQNFPNPFNSTTSIAFSIPKREQVAITIYDVQGRKVKTIMNNMVNPGQHSVKVQADFLTSGIYFYQMIAGEFTECRKLILIK